MAEQRMKAIKQVQGRLLFTRCPVGAESLEPEPASIHFDEVIGPLFPFTHRRPGRSRVDVEGRHRMSIVYVYTIYIQTHMYTEYVANDI